MKKREKGLKRVLVLTAELLALAVLISAAFYAPQMVFRVQDYLMCANISLSKRETMDVDKLSTTYERSLKQRMTNYVDGLEAGENYYVAEQPLEINQEVYEYLSDILYHEIVLSYVEAGVIPLDFFDYQSEYTVTRWKRYVIYSEDYAKGVSFILWYIELQDRVGVVMKLLADGEDGTIYALRTEANGLLDTNEISSDGGYNMSYDRILDLSWIFNNTDYLAQMWEQYALYYEALSRADTNSYIVNLKEKRVAQGENVYWESETYENDAEGCKVRFNLPYGENFVEFLVDIGRLELGLKYVTYLCPDFTMGIRQIYEKIPEFA